jgi:hypothetical protein
VPFFVCTGRHSPGLGLRGCCVSSPPESAPCPLTQVACDVSAFFFVDTEMVEVAGDEGSLEDPPGSSPSTCWVEVASAGHGGAPARTPALRARRAAAAAAAEDWPCWRCQRLVGLEIGGFDHEQIGLGLLRSCLGKGACVADIPDKKEARPVLERPRTSSGCTTRPPGRADRAVLGPGYALWPWGTPSLSAASARKGRC